MPAVSLHIDIDGAGQAYVELSPATEACVKALTQQAQARGLSGISALEYVMAEMFKPWNEDPEAHEPHFAIRVDDDDAAAPAAKLHELVMRRGGSLFSVDPAWLRAGAAFGSTERTHAH